VEGRQQCEAETGVLCSAEAQDLMTPSSSIMTSAAATETVTDDDGRRLTIRRLTALDRLRLFKAAGPILAQNQPWLGMALIASSVDAIDEVPVPTPANETQIEAMVARLGDSGISAVAEALQQSAQLTTAELLDNAGN
jgi:hypothetical protein